MATTKQNQAARKNLEKARETQGERAQGESAPRRHETMSTAEKNELSDSEFAFPKERKEPLQTPPMSATLSPASTRLKV